MTEIDKEYTDIHMYIYIYGEVQMSLEFIQNCRQTPQSPCKPVFPRAS